MNEIIKFILEVPLDTFIDEVRTNRGLKIKLIKMQDSLHPGASSHDKNLLKSLDKEAVIKFVKVFTLLDQIESRGSVCCVSHILNYYQSSFNPSEEEYETLLDWVFEKNNGENPWLATGSALYSVKSIKEMNECIAHQRLKKQLRSEAESKRQKEAAERIKLQASHDIWNAIRRKDLKAISALISKGASLDQKNANGDSANELIDGLLKSSIATMGNKT